MKKNLVFTLSVFLIFGVFGFSDISSSVEQPEPENRLPQPQEVNDVTQAEVMQTIEKAYAVEADAAYSLDLSKFPTVFVNDPRFDVRPSTLETIKELTQNPSVESAGYLDYKMAYYGWMRDAILRSEAVHAKAQAENRPLTKEEQASLIDPKGRTAPARNDRPIGKIPLIFMSVTIKDDIAMVVLNEGARTVELTLVLIDQQWYIAGSKTLSVHP